LTDAGTVSREVADAKAQAEYETFAARRRALLETEGRESGIQALEQAAKQLPKRNKKD
jgi:hypothetical protein